MSKSPGGSGRGNKGHCVVKVIVQIATSAAAL